MSLVDKARDEALVARYREVQNISTVAAEFEISRQRVSQILLRQGISPVKVRRKLTLARERMRSIVKKRKEDAKESPREHLYRMCRELGYVPSASDLQREHRALEGRLVYSEDGGVAAALDDAARDLGLPRRKSVMGPGEWQDLYRSAYRRAQVFRVPSHLYLHTRMRFDFRELRYARYPFEVVEVILDRTEPRFASDSGKVRVERVLYERSGDVHRIFVTCTVDGQSFHHAAKVTIDEGDMASFVPLGATAGPDAFLTISESATYWLGLVNLCHLIENRELIEVVRTDEDGAAINRQQARALARSTGRTHYSIVLRPTVTRRVISHAISRSRIETLRAHPRRHLVSEHARRYHTKGGTIVKSIAPFQRGGKGTARKTYDARPLYAEDAQ